MTSTDRIAEIEARLSALGRTAVGTKNFVVHAPTDIAALLDVVKAVREIHRPEWASDHHGGGFYRCQADGWTLDETAPACPTAAAVEKLGGAA